MDLGAWALVGAEPAGRFLLERLRIRADFPLVAVCATEAISGSWNVVSRQQLLEDARVSGVILTVPVSQRADWIRAALSAGKRVLVESSPGLTSADVAIPLILSALADGSLGVFHVQRVDQDGHAAVAAVHSGRLGELRSVRYISCESAIADGRDWRDTLRHVGPALFDWLAEIAGPRKYVLQAWPTPATAGFQVRLQDARGFTAWFDIQRSSLCDLRTGWVLEGANGAYHRGRLITRAADGELLEEEISPGPGANDDVICDLLHLAASPDAARLSLQRAMQSFALMEQIAASGAA